MGEFKDSLKKAKENANMPINNPISDVEKSYNQRLNDADKLANEIKREFENDCKETKYREYTIFKSKNELSKSHGKEVSLQLNKGSKKCIEITINVYFSKAEIDMYKGKEKIHSATNASDLNVLIKQLINDAIFSKSNEEQFYRQSRDTFIRSIGEYGYIYSQLTKHDRTYTREGQAFLDVLSREPQSLDALAAKACEYFENVTPADIKYDLMEFLDSLVADRYLISGNTIEECAAKDTYFSYAENPKTLFTYNAQQNPDDDKLYSDTQEILGTYYQEHPQIHSCQIETTNRCNERCIHCYIPHELKNVLLPYEVIENVLQQLHDLGVMGLTLSGGEFFTHPEAEKILRKARELDFSFTILSNITLITPKMIEVLKEVNPGLIQTSLYSVYPEEHDHITQLKGSCEKTKAAIDALIAANIPVQISCPVMKTNYHTYKDVLKHAYERNCKAQTDYVMMARYDFTTDNLAERLTMEQTEELLKDIIRFDKDYMNFTDTPVPEVSREEWGKRPFCGVGMDNLCIASDGIVYPCSGWQGMACGNVREQPIKDIWEKSPQLKKLRNLTKSAIPQCYDCEDRQFCAPCLVRNFNESGGDYLKVAPHFCKAAHLNRKLVEEARAKMKSK